VTISKRILLDEQPPTLWNIVIEANGALVWDPSVYVHLKVHWIRVDGEMHIGSKDCPFTAKTRITFLGASITIFHKVGGCSSNKILFEIVTLPLATGGYTMIKKYNDKKIQ
jgi:hypothetical protein